MNLISKLDNRCLCEGSLKRRMSQWDHVLHREIGTGLLIIVSELKIRRNSDLTGFSFSLKSSRNGNFTSEITQRARSTFFTGEIGNMSNAWMQQQLQHYHDGGEGKPAPPPTTATPAAIAAVSLPVAVYVYPVAVITCPSNVRICAHPWSN